MTYGLISDIHANMEALEAVLGALGPVDAFLCMGDIVGYGAEPGPCIERVRALPRLVCVAGNHDLAAVGEYDLDWFNPLAKAAIEWTARRLSADDVSYLRGLPRVAHAEGAVMVHGSLPDEMGYITTPEEARGCFDAMPGDLAFIGHTHITEYYQLRRETVLPQQVAVFSGGEVDLEKALRYIVNPGAVGQPRDGNKAASFGVWRIEERVIEIRRVEYDVGAAQRKITEAGLPQELAWRLAEGR